MRWLIRSVLALCLLVVLAIGAIALIPSDQVAKVAAERFERITGRSLRIEGAVRPSVWPTLGVKTGAVEIANANWSTSGPMLRAEALEIGVDLAALWGGSVRVTAIRAERPEIMLERAADGRANWEFGGSNGGTAAPGMAGEGTPFTLDQAEIAEGRFSFVDHGSGQRLSLTDVSGTLRVPVFDGAAEARIAAKMLDQPLELALNAANFSALLEGQLTEIAADVTAGAARLRFAGRAGWQPVAAEGTIDADLADLVAVSRLAGVARPDLPEGLGARSLTVAGAMTLTESGSLHLRGGTVTLDDNRLSVDADLTPGEARPKLSAKVTAGDLRLAGLAGGEGGGAGGGVAAEGWSTTRIDVSGLGVIDAALGLSAASVDLGVMRLGPSQVSLTLDRGRAVFDLRRIEAYQGTITGQFVVNGRKGLSVGGDLTLAGLAMQPLLTDLGGYDRLIGTAETRLKFLGVGDTLDQIMRSLSGEGRFAFGKGELRGLDIGGMLRTLDASFVGEGQKTIFDSLSASFVIEGGVLRNDDLALRAPYLTSGGAGQVGIGARTLDYRLRPTALPKADGTGGITVPLLITGTWARPKFRLDLESLARERLEEEAKALEERARAEAKAAEARAKAELERKAQEELGIQRQEGESLEDAAKRRAQEAIEDEAARALRRLLGQP